MEPAWFGRAKKSADRMAAVRRSIAEVADCANPGLPSLHGRLGSVGALFHDAVRLRAARHGAALVEAQPGVTGIGIARTLVLAIGVRIVERAIAGFAHGLLGRCGSRHHRQRSRRTKKPVDRHRIPPCEGPEGCNPARTARIPRRASHTPVTTAPPVSSSSGAIMPGFAADFLDEMDAFDANAALNRLDHVVDREAGDR